MIEQYAYTYYVPLQVYSHVMHVRKKTHKKRHTWRQICRISSAGGTEMYALMRLCLDLCWL